MLPQVARLAAEVRAQVQAVPPESKRGRPVPAIEESDHDRLVRQRTDQDLGRARGVVGWTGNASGS
jgi:hypothetical protein